MMLGADYSGVSSVQLSIAIVLYSRCGSSRCLQGAADANRDKSLTVGELQAYLEERVLLRYE